MAYYGRDYNRSRYNRYGRSGGYDYGFGAGYEGFGRWNPSRSRGWGETERDRFGYGGRGSGWGQSDFDDEWNRSRQGWGRNFDDDWGSSQRFHEGDYGYGGSMGRGGGYGRYDRGYFGRDRDRNTGSYDEDFSDRLRRGWRRLRDEARDWMGRGYDRGW